MNGRSARCVADDGHSADDERGIATAGSATSDVDELGAVSSVVIGKKPSLESESARVRATMSCELWRRGIGCARRRPSAGDERNDAAPLAVVDDEDEDDADDGDAAASNDGAEATAAAVG